MVNAGRVACIATPFALSLLALLCLVIIFMAGTIKGNSTLDDLYFLKLDLNNMTLSDGQSLLGAKITGNTTVLSGAIDAAKHSLGIEDYYTIYLRSYCAWSGKSPYLSCSQPQSNFWFNPISVWGLNKQGDVSASLPKQLQDGLNAYKATSKVMFILFVVSLAASALTLLVGISAMFSRWGSFVTTIIAGATGIAYLAAAAVMTALFITLSGVLNTQLNSQYHIYTTIGRNAQIIVWAGAAFSFGAGLFWLLSVCFCSGRSPYHSAKEARRTKAEKTPYTYERVGSPSFGPQDQSGVPMNNFNYSHQNLPHDQYNQPQQHYAPQSYTPQHAEKTTAYEPFRSQPI